MAKNKRPARRAATKRNPLVERRFARGAGPGGKPLVVEVDPDVGWNVVGFLPGNALSGAAWMRYAVDVRTDGGELVVYYVSSSAVRELEVSAREQHDARYETWKSPDENDAALQRAYDFAREHADYVVRGQARDVSEPARSSAPDDWRDVLRHFVDPPEVPRTAPARDAVHFGFAWERLLWHTPVSVDGGEPARLDVALFTSRAQRELYEDLVAQAYWVRDYNRNNADSVESFLTAGIDFVGCALRGDVYSAGPYGHGVVTRGSLARDRMVRLVERAQAAPSDTRVWQDFRREVRDQVEHSPTFWHRADDDLDEGAGDARRALVDERDREWGPEDYARHYVFFEYETEDWVDDPLEDAVVDRALALAQQEGWGALLEVVAALEEVEVHWDVGAAAVPHHINIGEVDASWKFSIDLDALEEWLDELVEQEEDEPEEDEG